MSSLTKKQRRVLEGYARLRISLEELKERLAGVLDFNFKDHERRLEAHYGTPTPGVRIERKDIQAAWTNMLLLVLSVLFRKTTSGRAIHRAACRLGNDVGF